MSLAMLLGNDRIKREREVGMTAKTITDIKRDLQGALDAIEALERVYPSIVISLDGKTEDSGNATSRQDDTGNSNLTIRERVRRVAKGKLIREMADETGLTKSQVRGVVNAPNEAGNYEKKEIETGEMKYRFKGSE